MMDTAPHDLFALPFSGYQVTDGCLTLRGSFALKRWEAQQ